MATAAKPKVGGAVFYAPITASLPTSASATLDGSFANVGYISDAGVTRSVDLDSDTVKAWGGDVVLVLNNSKTETFNFAMLDSSDVNVLKLVNGSDNVTGTALATGISVKSNNADNTAHAFVIDMVEANDTAHRIVIPNGVITSIGDVTYVDNGAISYEVTITGIADSSGNTVYEYLLAAGSSGS